MNEGLKVLREMRRSLETRRPMVFGSQLDIIEKELREKDELAQALSMAAYENGNLLKYKRALEIIGAASLNVVYYGYIDDKDVYALRIGERDIKYIQREEYDLLRETLL